MSQKTSSSSFKPSDRLSPVATTAEMMISKSRGYSYDEIERQQKEHRKKQQRRKKIADEKNKAMELAREKRIALRNALKLKNPQPDMVTELVAVENSDWEKEDNKSAFHDTDISELTKLRASSNYKSSETDDLDKKSHPKRRITPIPIRRTPSLESFNAAFPEAFKSSSGTKSTKFGGKRKK